MITTLKEMVEAEERIKAMEQQVAELREALKLTYEMASLCPVDALSDDFDFVTPLEKAEQALLDKTWEVEDAT